MATKVVHFIRLVPVQLPARPNAGAAPCGCCAARGCCRHGQSTANAAQLELVRSKGLDSLELSPNDKALFAEVLAVMNRPEHFDARLTALGLCEAARTREVMRGQVKVQLVVCSTLRRAMQTAAAIFPDPPGKIIALDHVREFAGPPIRSLRPVAYYRHLASQGKPAFYVVQRAATLAPRAPHSAERPRARAGALRLQPRHDGPRRAMGTDGRKRPVGKVPAAAST